MLEGIAIATREMPEQYQRWIEELGATLEHARRQPPLQQEAHEALLLVARVAAAGRELIGTPRIALVGSLPMGLRRINGGGR